MSSRRIQLRLVQSPGMSEKGENGIIRFPRKARESFGFSNNMVVLGKGTYQRALQVKKAYKEDVRRLARMLQQGRLTEEEALYVGFVTKTVQGQVSRKEGGSLWVSDGIGHITVGADPEFGLIGEHNCLQRGSNVLPKAGVFGSDGPSVEVRPPPDTSHLVVVRRIEEILKKPPAAAEAYEWRGGASHEDMNRAYWFGGHIHLGRPIQVPQEQAYPVYEKLASTLDSLLALPMVKFDTPDPQSRRKGCPYGYGMAGTGNTGAANASVRAHPDRFEWRVLSGLWLVHPTLAKIALGAAQCITETAYGRLASTGFDFDWAAAPASRKGLLHSFKLKDVRQTGAIINNALPQLVTPEVLKIWRTQIRSLDLFDEYSEELEALIALTSAGSTEFSLDVRKNWYEPGPLLPKATAKLRSALDAVEEK